MPRLAWGVSDFSVSPVTVVYGLDSDGSQDDIHEDTRWTREAYEAGLNGSLDDPESGLGSIGVVRDDHVWVID